jgi:transcriptional regulator with XRE-family HTH domain
MRDPYSALIAANLERLLAERGVSALALAERCNLGRSGVYDILAGRSQSPKISTVGKLAAGLGVPISEMFLTADQLAAQSELFSIYAELEPAEQRRLAQVARAFRLG